MDSEEPPYCVVCGDREAAGECARCQAKTCSEAACVWPGKGVCTICVEAYCGLCELTELTGDCNVEKFCEGCQRTCCLERGCVALTWCQCAEGVCVDCFDFVCRGCKTAELPRKLYLGDGDPEDRPLCEDCSTEEESG